MAWSGGSVSFSGGPNTFSVSYSAPSYSSPPTGYVVTAGPYVSSAGPSSVSCGSSASQTYEVELTRSSPYSVIYQSTTISGSAPACPPPPSYPPSWTDNTLAGFQANVAYSDGVSATNMNYGGSYSVSAGSLPSGISLNSSTGAVTGTPTTAGQSYSFTITASNSYPPSISQTFSGTVAAAPTAGYMAVYNGTSFVKGPVKVFNGTVWSSGAAYIYNGSTWVKSV
ncbi:MAG: Ig domain-containing protein [Micrococcales bacterium]